MFKYPILVMLMGIIPSFAQPAAPQNPEPAASSGKNDINPPEATKPESETPAKKPNPAKTLVKLPGLKIKNMSGYAQFGWQQLSLTSTNSALLNAGYPSLSTDYFTGGAGGHLSVERVVLGLDGDVAWNVAKETTLSGSTLKSSMMAVRLSGIIGYLIYTTERIDIFPFLGVGFSQMNLTLQNTQPDSFNNVLLSPQRGAWLSSSSFVLTTGIQMMLRIPLVSFANADFGLLVGGKIGMNFGFGGDNWSLGSVNNTVAVTDGAAAAYGGPFAQMVLGTWLNFNP